MQKNFNLLLQNLKQKIIQRRKPLIFLGIVPLLFWAFALLPASRVLSTEKLASADRVDADTPVVEAQSALAMRLRTGKILFEKNKSEVRPLASITKVVSALTILRFLDPSEKITVSAFAVATEEPSSLLVGEHFAVRDLLAMAMVESSNDAVMALVERLGDTKWFLDLMGETARELGAETMRFYTPTGLDVSTDIAGGYGSATDLLAIVARTLDTPVWQLGSVREVVSDEGLVHTLRPTNVIDADITPLIGAKTGFTDLAGGNLLIITEYPIGEPLGIVVLGSTLEGRFSDVKKIFEWIKTISQ